MASLRKYRTFCHLTAYNIFSTQLEIYMLLFSLALHFSYIPLNLVGETCSEINQAVDLLIRCARTSYSLKIRCYVTDKVTVNLPTIFFDTSNILISNNAQLTDPNFKHQWIFF